MHTQTHEIPSQILHPRHKHALSTFTMKGGQYLHRPVYVSPSLHVVQRGDHQVQSGVEGVIVDALSGWTHLVEVSVHLKVGVDIASGFCCRCTLRFLTKTRPDKERV